MTNARPGPITRYDWVDARLQAEIVLGNLPAGSRVKVNDLARDWTLSPAPLREAVQRLAARGVLEMSPQRGARVAPVSLREAHELYELRMQLEPQALRLSMLNADESYNADVIDAHRSFMALGRRPRSNPASASDIYLAHRTFHDATMSRCTVLWLLRLVGVLMDQTMRYIRFTFAKEAPRRGEHDELVELIVSGDVNAAPRALLEHLERSSIYLESALAKAGLD